MWGKVGWIVLQLLPKLIGLAEKSQVSGAEKMEFVVESAAAVIDAVPGSKVTQRQKQVIKRAAQAAVDVHKAFAVRNGDPEQPELEDEPEP